MRSSPDCHEGLSVDAVQRPAPSLLRRLLCRLGRHRLMKLYRLSSAADMIGCEHCARRWGMNHDVRAFLPWDDISEIYEGPDAIFPPETWRRYVRVR